MFSRSVVEGVVEDCGDAVKMSRVKGLKREVIIIIKARTWDLWRGDWGGKDTYECAWTPQITSCGYSCSFCVFLYVNDHIQMVCCLHSLVYCWNLNSGMNASEKVNFLSNKVVKRITLGMILVMND